MKKTFFLSLIVIPIFFACSKTPPTKQENQIPTSKETETKVTVVQKEPPVTVIPPTAYKKEVLELNGICYPIPEQWLGKRIDAPPLSPPALTMIPLEFAHEEKKHYLLNEANLALQRMASAAKKNNITLLVNSAYRSSRYQRQIFLKKMGQGRSFEDVIRYVAPPGYSEHALGTVVDFYPGNWRFSTSAAYQWLKNNAGTFHFTESYPEHGDMPWESWHWRWRKD